MMLLKPDANLTRPPFFRGVILPFFSPTGCVDTVEMHPQPATSSTRVRSAADADR